MITHANTQLYKAVNLALDYHDKQMYGEYTYVYHLNQVDQMVLKMYIKPYRLPGEPHSIEPNDYTDKIRALCYLHDIIEDTEMTSEELLIQGILPEVVQAAVAITKHKGQTYDDYIEAVKANPLALQVKLCDTACNLQNSIAECNGNRINKYVNQLKLLGGFKGVM